MVRHIVMWKVRPSEDKTNDIQTVKAALEGLKNKLEEIVDWKAGINLSQKEEACTDIVLNSSFATMENLSTYQNHPEHIKVVKIIRSLTIERRVADYQL